MKRGVGVGRIEPHGPSEIDDGRINLVHVDPYQPALYEYVTVLRVDPAGGIQVFDGFGEPFYLLFGTCLEHVHGFAPEPELDGLVAVDQAGIVFFQVEVGAGAVEPDLPVFRIHRHGPVEILHRPLEVLQLAAHDGAVEKYFGHVGRQFDRVRIVLLGAHVIIEAVLGVTPEVKKFREARLFFNGYVEVFNGVDEIALLKVIDGILLEFQAGLAKAANLEEHQDENET